MDYDWKVRTAKVPYSGRNTCMVTQTYVLRHDMPGYSYIIYVDVDGGIFSRSCTGSGGGFRYHRWGDDCAENLWRALDHGIAWARRHQRHLTRAA